MLAIELLLKKRETAGELDVFIAEEAIYKERYTGRSICS